MKPRRSAADGTGGITGARGRIRKNKKKGPGIEWLEGLFPLADPVSPTIIQKKKKNKNVKDNR